jgi:hypothetical protein
LVLFALGGGLVYVGQEWGVAYATDIGIVVLGILMVAAGLDIIIKKLGVFRIEGWSQAHAADTYRGILEVLWGVIFIGIGLVMAAVVPMNRLAPGNAGTFWSDLLMSSTGIGVILSAVGLMSLLSGLIRALAGSGRVDPRRLGGVPYAMDRLAGAATSLFGLLLAAIGLALLVAPGAAGAALEPLKNLLAGG